MLNCKDMTKVISDSLDRKITLRQRVELWMHIMMCGLCRRFRSNALALRKRVREAGVQGIEEAGAQQDDAALTVAAKHRIAAAIKEQRG